MNYLSMLTRYTVNSQRFHNIVLQENEKKQTAAKIVGICSETLGVPIAEDNIFRSHMIGKLDRHGMAQSICRFRNCKANNSIYSQKKSKTDGIIITEDLS